MRLLHLFIIAFIGFATSVHAQDWPNLKKFQEKNAQLDMSAKSNRVVFMGNSITEGWGKVEESIFDNPNYINRGISGQTTPQMLVRFKQDVVHLRPKMVIILAGINDIAGNTGPSSLEMIMDNISSMVEIAKANKIIVLLSSVLPAFDFPWRPGMEPAEKVIELNTLLKEYAAKNKLVYCDYFTPMVDDKNGLKADLSSDGVHPNKAGYDVMKPIAEAAIAKAFKKKY